MKKIWVLRYNDGTADVWDEEKGPPSWPYVDAFDVEDTIKELHSDYAALLTRHNALRYNTKVIIKAYRENRTRHNALVEAVAVVRDQIQMMRRELPKTIGDVNIPLLMEDLAEVDRLIAEVEG